MTASMAPDIRMTATEVLARQRREVVVLRGLHQHPKATTTIGPGRSCAFKPHIVNTGNRLWTCSGLRHVGIGESPARAYAVWSRSLNPSGHF